MNYHGNKEFGNRAVEATLYVIKEQNSMDQVIDAVDDLKKLELTGK